MMYDTDVLIWFLRGNEKAALLLNRDTRRVISQVSWMELVQGARNKGELSSLKSFAHSGGFLISPLTESVGNRAVFYLEQHALRDGLLLADSLVAATAAELGMPLATANVKHFRKLAGLDVYAFKP